MNPPRPCLAPTADRRRRRWRATRDLAGGFAGALLLAACTRTEQTEPPSPTARPPAPPAAAAIAAAPAAVREEPITPIPLTLALDARKVALGKKLFHDPILSQDKSVSCASCHPLHQGGADRLPHSIGIRGQAGTVNAPTVFNSGLNFRQFWDGRADTLEAQIDGPTQSPSEMGASWDEMLARLRRDPVYAAAFAEVYPAGVQRESVKHAIAEFERSLLTPNSRFDRWLRGDATALTAGERAGYAKFKNYGCISCHQGVNVGANMFQRMGAIRDYFADRGRVTEADFGRFNVTHNEADKFFFKVPSLRNVALNAPYFHDASAKTLEEAIEVMFKYQLGRVASKQDKQDIAQFLHTLSAAPAGQR